MGSILAGQTPHLPPVAGVAFVLLGLLALFVTRAQRRRLALALWAVLIAVGWLVTAIAAGALPPLVASPIEAGVLASLAWAGLAGLAVAGIRLDLGHTRFGYRQPLAVGAGALAGALLLVGLAPSLWHAAWAPTASAGRSPETTSAAGSVLPGAGSSARGRILWVGRGWQPRVPTGSQPARDYFITDGRGRSITDLFPASSGAGEGELASSVAAIQEGQVDEGGLLLGSFDISWVALDGSAGSQRWLDQRDLTLVREGPDFALLQNADAIRHAGVYDSLPSAHGGFVGPSSSPPSAPPKAEAIAEELSTHSYRAAGVQGPATAFLAEQRAAGWTATLSGQDLARVGPTWGNAFRVPAGDRGDLAIAYHRPLALILWLVAVGLGWLVAAGTAFASSKGRGVA
jgi:hypothetical protein